MTDPVSAAATAAAAAVSKKVFDKRAAIKERDDKRVLREVLGRPLHKARTNEAGEIHHVISGLHSD